MSTKSIKKNKESESLKEQIIKLEKQLESFKHSNEHFLKNKLFLHYDIKEPEKVVLDCETKLPVLREVDKKKIQKGKESDPTHLLIEGDNYHALSVLNYTHAGKIDLIYIDPPYNTGNKDFIYNDYFVDREDSFRHSKWLSFMAHRLRLAKNLLAEKGVIFISIDDNEQAHLRLLCDQVFGEQSFVTTIHVQMSTVSGQKVRAAKGGNIVKNAEYVLVYSKSGKKNIGKSLLYDPVEYDTHYSIYLTPVSKGVWKDSSFVDECVNNDEIFNLLRIAGLASIKDKKRYFSIKNLQKAYSSIESFRDFVHKNSDRIVRTDRMIEVDLSKLEKHIKPNATYTYLHKSGKNYLYGIDKKGEMKQRFLLSEKIREADDFYKTYGITNLRGDWWPGFHLDMGNVPKEGGVDFLNGKKPVRLIKQLINYCLDKDGTILDFFAGSGTTGQAVLELNKKDSGMRQFILCSTNDEKEPIVDKVTYPRIEKVINGYGDNAPIPANLRYFQTDFVEKKGSASQLKIDLTRQCVEMLCVKENVFEAVKLKKQAKNYKFFKNGDKYLGVFFDFFTDAEFAGFTKELNTLPKAAEKAVYVFVLDGSAGILADEFAGVANCEVKEIPQKILDIYKQLAREVVRK